MATGAAVTTVGKGLIAAAMVAQHVARYVAHGTGTTTPAVTDSGLETAADLNSGSAWLADSEAVNSSVKYRIVITIDCGSTESITEVALFDVAAMTNCLYHEVFSAISASDGDSVTYTIDITVG